MAQKLNDGPGPSDEMIQRFYTEVSTATRVKDEAVGSLRAILKRAKSAGVAPAMLTGMVADKKRDPDELRIEVLQRLRGLAFLNMPITQQELFGETGELSVSPAIRAMADRLDVEAAGYQAGMAERAAGENPHVAGSEFHALWASHHAEGAARRTELDRAPHGGPDSDEEAEEDDGDSEPAPRVVKASTARKRRAPPGVVGHA